MASWPWVDHSSFLTTVTTVPGFDLEDELHKHEVEASSEARAHGKHAEWSEIIRLLEHRGKAVDSVVVRMLPAATVNWVRGLEQATLPPTVTECLRTGSW